MKIMEAVYEQGVLRLKEPLEIADGTTVEVLVAVRPSAPEAGSEPGGRKKTVAEIVAEIAAMYVESGNGESFSGEDHDQILDGGEGGAR